VPKLVPITKKNREVALDLNFLVVLSHELTQPLTAAAGSIISLKRFLDEDSPEGESQAKFIEIALRNLDQLQALLDSLRLFSEAETGTLEIEAQAVPVKLLLSNAIEDFGEPRTHTTIAFQCEPHLHANVSVTLFRQVLSNLINNADKFSPDGSEIVVKARSENGEAIISVIDQGPGFPQNESERIFGKYVRLQAGKKGLGVGLFVAKAIVEAHHGRIWAENTDTGAKFSVSVPTAVPA
jgi:two-component system, OmpR family, sensor histidine kinase VicK